MGAVSSCGTSHCFLAHQNLKIKFKYHRASQLIAGIKSRIMWKPSKSFLWLIRDSSKGGLGTNNVSYWVVLSDLTVLQVHHPPSPDPFTVNNCTKSHSINVQVSSDFKYTKRCCLKPQGEVCGSFVLQSSSARNLHWVHVETGSARGDGALVIKLICPLSKLRNTSQPPQSQSSYHDFSLPLGN